MTEILTNNDLFCFCGKVAKINVNGKYYCCPACIGKEVAKNPKERHFRGDSKWQIEQGYGKNKEGSNA